MLFQAGDYAEAHALYEELAAETGSVELAFNNGVTLALMGDDRAAVAAYEATLALDPGNAQARLYLGNALLRLGRQAEAVEAYRHYLGDNSRGEAAERVRRILKQIAPDAIPRAPVEPGADELPVADESRSAGRP
jgi:tetratricopeptide (TPR) repeat protein